MDCACGACARGVQWVHIKSHSELVVASHAAPLHRHQHRHEPSGGSGAGGGGGRRRYRRLPVRPGRRWRQGVPATRSAPRRLPGSSSGRCCVSIGSGGGGHQQGGGFGQVRRDPVFVRDSANALLCLPATCRRFTEVCHSSAIASVSHALSAAATCSVQPPTLRQIVCIVSNEYQDPFIPSLAR